MSTGSRITEAAVEIISETFDGILGANSRASSSYSACRPIQKRRKIQINKPGHLSETHRLFIPRESTPRNADAGGRFQKKNRMRSTCNCSPV